MKTFVQWQMGEGAATDSVSLPDTFLSSGKSTVCILCFQPLTDHKNLYFKGIPWFKCDVEKTYIIHEEHQTIVHQACFRKLFNDLQDPGKLAVEPRENYVFHPIAYEDPSFRDARNRVLREQIALLYSKSQQAQQNLDGIDLPLMPIKLPANSEYHQLSQYLQHLFDGTGSPPLETLRRPRYGTKGMHWALFDTIIVDVLSYLLLVFDAQQKQPSTAIAFVGAGGSNIRVAFKSIFVNCTSIAVPLQAYLTTIYNECQKKGSEVRGVEKLLIIHYCLKKGYQQTEPSNAQRAFEQRRTQIMGYLQQLQYEERINTFFVGMFTNTPLGAAQAVSAPQSFIAHGITRADFTVRPKRLSPKQLCPMCYRSFSDVKQIVAVPLSRAASEPTPLSAQFVHTLCAPAYHQAMIKGLHIPVFTPTAMTEPEQHWARILYLTRVFEMLKRGGEVEPFREPAPAQPRDTELLEPTKPDGVTLQTQPDAPMSSPADDALETEWEQYTQLLGEYERIKASNAALQQKQAASARRYSAALQAYENNKAQWQSYKASFEQWQARQVAHKMQHDMWLAFQAVGNTTVLLKSLTPDEVTNLLHYVLTQDSGSKPIGVVEFAGKISADSFVLAREQVELTILQDSLCHLLYIAQQAEREFGKLAVRQWNPMRQLQMEDLSKAERSIQNTWGRYLNSTALSSWLLAFAEMFDQPDKEEECVIRLCHFMHLTGKMVNGIGQQLCREQNYESNMKALAGQLQSDIELARRSTLDARQQFNHLNVLRKLFKQCITSNRSDSRTSGRANGATSRTSGTASSTRGTASAVSGAFSRGVSPVNDPHNDSVIVAHLTQGDLEKKCLERVALWMQSGELSAVLVRFLGSAIVAGGVGFGAAEATEDDGLINIYSIIALVVSMIVIWAGVEGLAWRLRTRDARRQASYGPLDQQEDTPRAVMAGDEGDLRPLYSSGRQSTHSGSINKRGDSSA